MKGIVKVQMFPLPNFLKIDVPGSAADSGSIDVGHLFPTDNDALIFWQDCQLKWIEHVAKRRAAANGPEQR
jgi:hypothetical protein